MSRRASVLLTMAALVVAVPAFAVDGTVLINQSSVTAAGGFPFNIFQAGSYKLSGNLVVPDGVDGIHISASGVTLDLNGFSIVGANRCDPSIRTCTPSQHGGLSGIFYLTDGIAIRNGRVSGFDIGIQGLEGTGLVEEVQVIGNTGFGILAKNAVIRVNNVSRNGGLGIACGSCVVLENIVDFNGLSGVNLGGGIFGSNVINGNGAASLVAATVVSQHNSSCEGAGC